MAVMFNTVNIAFTGTKKDEKKDAEKKIVTGTGATAAAAKAATTAKKSKSAFDVFESSKKLSQNLKTVSNTSKAVTDISTKSVGLWAKVKDSFKWARDSVLKWGAKFKNMKYVKPLVESPLFRGVASVLGFGFGVVTLISGGAEIMKAATDTANNTFAKEN